MEDEKNGSMADFLNNFSDKEDIFKEEPAESDTSEEVEDEKPLPFHKDPKVQRYVDKQIEKAIKAIPTPDQRTAREETSPSDVKDVIAAFTAIVGNDTPEKVKALEALEKTLAGADERASQKAIERFQQQVQEQEQQRTKEDEAAITELNSGFEEIEETLGVDLTSNTAQAQKLNLEFRQYLKKIAPKDENGEVKSFPDIPAAFEEFQERNKRAPATRAKELASRGMTRSNDTATSAPTGKSWKDVDRFFDKLKANT